MNCVNINHPDFKNLLEGSGIGPALLRAKIGIWMEENNNFEEFPTLAELGLKKDYSIPGAALKQVDELRKLIPENIQKKSQILTGLTSEPNAVGIIEANRTDLEVVSIFLKQKRYNKLTDSEQYEVRQWAEDYLNNTFFDPKKEKELDKKHQKEIEEQEKLEGKEGTTELDLTTEGMSRLLDRQAREMAEIKVPRDEFIVAFFKEDLFEVAEAARRRKMITIPGDTGRQSDVMYQVNLAKMYKQQASRIFYNDIQGKDLSEADIQRINQKLRQISDNAGDVQWRIRQAQSGNYYIAGYKNRSVTMDNYTSPYAGGMFRQLKSKSQEIQIEKLDIKLTNWAKKNGIPVESLKSVMEKFPDRYNNSALGIADFAKGLIAVADNRNIDTLAEEVAHFAIEMMLAKDENMQAALDQVVETQTYQDVLEEYAEIYKDEIDFKKEALGKILAAEIVNQFKNTERLSSNPGFWQTFKNAVVNFFNRIRDILGVGKAARTDLQNVIIPLAESILNEEKLDFFNSMNGYSREEILYQINQNKQTTFERPILSTTEELIKRKEKIYNNIITKLQARIKTFERTARSKRQIKTLKKDLEELTRLKDIGEIDLGISKFAIQAQEELSRVNNLMNDVANGESHMSAINLVTAHDFIIMYDNLFRDINENLIQKGVDKELREKLLEHTGEVHALIKNGLSTGQILLNSLAIKVLEKSNIDYNGEIIDKDFDPREIIESTYEDMSTWRLQVGNYKYADSGIIRTVAKILFNAKSNVDRFAKRLFNSLVGFQRAFLTKYKQIDLIETDANGKPTHYFARELNYSRFYASRQKVREDLAKKLNIKNPETGEFDYKYIDVTRLSKEDREIYNKTWKEWRDNNARSITLYDDEGNIVGSKTIPNDKYKNHDFIEKMKDPVFKNYYDAIIRTKTEAVDKLPVNYRTERLIYMVPSIYKSTLERLSTQSNDSFLTKIGKLGRDAFFVEADDTQFGQLNALNNRVVPIFFTGEVNNLADLSYDILRSVTLFAEMADNFKEMNSIAGELGAIQKSLAVREYKTKGRGQDKEGIESKEYQALENLINTQLYNIEREQLEYTFEESNLIRKGVLKATGGKVDLKDKSLSWTKLSQRIATFVRDNNLAFNLITSTVGWLKGSADSIIEDQIGIYTTNESKNFARKEMLKELGTVIADIGSTKQRSKMHLILQEAQIVKLDTMLHETDRGRFGRKVLNRDILYTTFATGDYGMKGRITLSIYDNYRLYNGKFMTKARFLKATSIEQGVKNDGVHAKKMAKEWEALREKSLYNAYEAVDGKLQIKDEFKEFVTEAVLNSVKGKVEHVSTNVDGVMSPTDKGKLSRTILGDFIFMHRGWFINLVDSKFKRGSVNYLSEEEEIGHYRAMGSYLRNVLKNIIGQGNTETTGAFAAWKELSPARKRGVKKTIADTVFLVIATVLAGIANKMADDDPDNMTNQYLGYVLNRLLLEQSAGFNLASTVEIIDEPVVGARLLKEAVSILDAFSGETYEKGMYEDWSHRGKYWFRKTPLKNLYELQYPDEKNKFIKTVVNSGYYNYLSDKEAFGITGWLLGNLIPYHNTTWNDYTDDQKRDNAISAIETLEDDNEIDNGFN